MLTKLLCHGLTHWTPGVHEEGDLVTPGRISWVSFTHEDTADQFSQQEAGYGLLSGGGIYGSVNPMGMMPKST